MKKPSLNGLDYLSGALYCIKGEFSSINSFSNFLRDDFVAVPFCKEKVLDKIEGVVEKFQRVSDTVGQEEATKLLVCEDLGRIRDLLTRMEIQDPEETVPKDYVVFGKVLQDLLGLSALSYPKIYIVDEFPPPYKKMQWSACAPDRADEERYGIPKGIYLLRKRLLPYFSSYLLAHEFIHGIIGEVYPHMLGRGLEDGICDLLGSTYLGLKTFGKEFCTNFMVSRRLEYGAKQFQEIYLDYFRQAKWLYDRFGLDGILELVNKGRKAIKEVETRLLLMKYDDVDLPKGNWDQDLTDIMNYLTSIYARNLVVSPLARYIAETIEVGDTVEMIIKDNNLRRTEAEKAIEELQKRVFLIVLNEGKIDYSDTHFLIASGALRYELGPK